MSQDRNKPSDPKVPKDANLGEQTQARKSFWDIKRTTPRGKVFWLDLETTGLGKQVVDFGPEKWNKIVKELDRETTLAGKLKIFKALDEYKYFEQVGLAQFVTHARHSPLAGRHPGIPAWPHGGGYTIWEDNLANTLSSKNFVISEFSRRRGIISASLEAARVGSASTTRPQLSKWAKLLQQSTKWGQTTTIRGWNAWFDVFATQAFMARHAGELDAANIDPFMMARKWSSGQLRVETMEEHYFDLLRWKGWRNPEWAQKHLRFGRMYAAKVGANPGDPIPIAQDIARVLEGKSSLLRGRFGWKAELLERVFNKYGSLESTLNKWKFPDNNMLSGLRAHDAMRDIAVEYELSRRFIATNKAIQSLDARWPQLSKMFPGMARDELIPALGLARSGVLGSQFTARGMRGDQWLRGLTNKNRIGDIVSRSNALFSDIASQSQGIYQPGGPAQVIESPFGNYLRLIWQKGLGGTGPEELATGLGLVRGGLTKAINKIRGLPKPIQAIGGLGLLFGLYNAFGRRQETVDSNIPYNYIPGQQGQKVLDVPWGSPYQGPATDDRTAAEMLFKGGLILGAKAGFYHLPRFVYNVSEYFQPGSGAARIRGMYFGARLLEDLTPFRLGRMFNVSGYWSSYMTPPKYSLAADALVQGTDLTGVGRTYARTLGISDDVLKAHVLTEGGLSFTKVAANSAFMKTTIQGRAHEIRMFEAYSRIAHTFAITGASARDITPVMGGAGRQANVGRLLFDPIDPFETGLGRRVLRGIHRLAPNLVEGAIKRQARIPLWETDVFRRLQNTRGMTDVVFTPGYQRGQYGKLFSGLATDILLTGHNVLRRQAAVFGISMPAATSPGRILGGFAKAGAITWGALTAFNMANDTLGGALTDPFFNVWERGMLLRAKFSDMTGLTSLRQQMPDIQSTAAIAVATTPLVGFMLYKGMKRTKGLVGDFNRAAAEDFPYSQNTWGRNLEGRGINLREEAYRGIQTGARADIRKFFLKPEIYEEFGDMLSFRHLINPRNWTTRGKIFGGAFAAATALLTPFLLGSKYSEDQLKDIYSGEELVPVRRGRFYEMGSTPLEGGRVAYWRRHQIARRKLKAAEEVPGSERGLIPAIRSLFNPYWREESSYFDRPYPVTGGLFEDVPLIGPLLAGTVGRWLKPPRLMHTDRFRAGQPYEQYGEDMAPAAGLGGLPSPTPRDPYGLAAQIREFTYRTTEFAGLRGFITQTAGFRTIFGGDMPYERTPVLQPARMGGGIGSRFWEADLGGGGPVGEIFRRLFPRPERGTEVNPIRNTMPSWMPSAKSYFMDFQSGDPYNLVNYGEERLPGPGYAALHPDVEGLAPEAYPAFHKYNILADVAPWSRETRIQRAAAYRAARGSRDIAQLEQLDRIDRRVEAVKKRKEFQSYSFLADQTKINGSISGITPEGEITLAEYPHHTFRMAGVRFGVSSVADQLRRNNNLTKEEASIRAAQQVADRQNQLNNLLGANVSVSIPKGGLNAPEVEGVFSRGFVNINRSLVEQGLAGSEGGAPTAGLLTGLYGNVVEGIGHFPQHVPGPWMMFTKLFSQADPIEDYKRNILYGSQTRFWNAPYENFIRPYLYQTVSKLTPGEFVPRHVQKQREMDEYLDRMQFLKYAQEGNTLKAMRTMAGANVYGPPELLNQSLPYRERPFFDAFLEETDPNKRKRILSMVSSDMQRALVGQWSQQYAQTQGGFISAESTKERIGSAVQLAQAQVLSMGRKLPANDWVGYNKAVDWEDIKTVMVQSEGLDTHDFNIWDDRTNSLLRKPYLDGVVPGLTSRRMPTHINSMSRDLDRNLSNPHFPIETISHDQRVTFTMNNNVNYSNWAMDHYRKRRDNIFGI